MCSELQSARKPSILVPSPNVTDDHQKENALALCNLGQAILLEEEVFTANNLEVIFKRVLAEDRRLLKEMQIALERGRRNTACERIASEILGSVYY